MLEGDGLIIQTLRSAAIGEFTPEFSNCEGFITLQHIRHLNHFSLGAAFALLAEPRWHQFSVNIQKELLAISLTAQYLIKEKIDALNDLSRADNSIFLLKGASVFLDIYPKPSIRLMGDIDILVSSDDLEVIDKRLKQSGFIQESEYSEEFYSTIHHLMPYHKPETDVWIEVHHHIVPAVRKSASNGCFEPGFFFANKEYFQWEGATFSRAQAELNVLHIISHWVEEFRVKDSVIQLLDVVYICQKREDFSWQRFVSFLDDRYLASYTYFVLSYLKNNKILAIDDDVWSMISDKRRNIGRIEMKALQKVTQVLHRRCGKTYRTLGENNLSIIWTQLFEQGGGLLKVSKILYLLLFPGPNRRNISITFQLNRIKNMLKSVR